MIRQVFRFLLALALAAFGGATLAAFDPVNDDTDLFRNNPNIPSARPNVLIILDNTANWSSGGKFAAEKTALVNVVNSLDSSFNVGLMIFTQGGSCTTANVNGSYVRFGIRQMTAANKVALTTIVNGFADAPCGSGGDQGSSAAAGQAMHEAYLYFGGKISRSGITQTKRDFAGSTVNPTAGGLAGNPFASGTATTYTSPISDSCQKSYIIFISNGPFDNGDDSPSSTLYAGTSGLVPGATPIALTPSGSQSSWADEYAFYLANIGVNNLGGTQLVATYAVEVDPSTTGQGPGHTALMKSMANQGKGKYFGVTSASAGQAIVDALTSIFTEIQAVNSVFAASTLPVSVNVRGTNLNQLYIGVFRPDANDKPRWYGNLKAYQLKRDSATNTVFTVDSNLVAAINPTTGFITSTAKSFWTDPALPSATYWNFRSSSVNGIGGNSDSPDGDLVEKGGAAQQLRGLYFADGVNGTPSRPLYTCTQGPSYPVCNTNYSVTPSLLSATPFADANADITAGDLNIDSRTVLPLTAALTKPISSVVDRRTAVISNAGSTSQSLYTIFNNSTTFACYITLDNSRTVTINSISNGATSRTATFTKQGTRNRGTLTGHGMGVGQTIIVTGTTSFNTTGTTITTAAANTFDYGTFGGSGNPSESGTVTTSNVVVNVNAPAHGFADGQTVTIAGVTPAAFNGVKTITKVDDNNFRFSHVVSTAPSQAVVGVAMTASAPSTIVKATNSGACGAYIPAANQPFTLKNISSTTDVFLGNYVVSSSPAPAGGVFYFTMGTAQNLTAVNGNYYTEQTGTTAGAYFIDYTFTNPLGFVNGVNTTVNISGASPSGYNGAKTTTSMQDFGIANWVGLGSSRLWYFEYPVAAGIGQPSLASSGTPYSVAGNTSVTATGTLANHGFSVGDFVTVEGETSNPGSWNRSWQITAVPTTSTFEFSTGSALPPPDGTTNVRLTTNPWAFATIAGHGYGAAGTTLDPFTVSGATTAGYNGTFTGANAGVVVDANTVRYRLSSTPGANAGGTVLASTNSTTATGTSASHGFSVGTSITISGATPSAFNGTFAVTSVPNVDTFTYTLGSPQGAATGTISAVSAGGAGASERTNVINWIRGQDNFEDENSNSSFGDTRASIHGDVLHSRPAVVNYNRFSATDPTNADNDVFIFYGGNDGVFRAVKGGFGSTTGQASPGQEVWGFVAKEHFSSLKRLRLNSPAISSTYKKPYFFDGPIGTYTLDANNDGKLVAADGDKVWMFLTMRRGGRAIYALDISDPLVPKMMWRKGCPSLSTNAADIDPATGCDMGFGELGQTWSEPKIISINASSDPVLLFGAGYDALVEDLDPSTITSATTSSVVAAGTTYTRSMGRGLYAVNGKTGAIIWQAAGRARTDSSTHPYAVVSGMDFSISSDMSVVIGDPTPKPFRAYVGDNGGQVWRVDFGDANPANWTVLKLASLGDLTTAAGRRKFQFAPDVVGGSGYDMVIIGSGDREHPFDTTAANRVYGLKDRNQTNSPFSGGTQVYPTITTSATTTYGTLGTIPALLDVTSQCIELPSACTGTAPEVASAGASASANTSGALGSSGNMGWLIRLASGEKQVGATLASGSGAVQFATNQPSATAGGGSCQPNLGVARQYIVNYIDGTAFNGTTLSSQYAGGGFLPSPVLVYVALGGATGTGSTSTSGVGVGGTISGGTIGIGAGASTGGSGNVASAVVCYGASCSLAPGSVLFSRLRKFWYKEID